MQPHKCPCCDGYGRRGDAPCASCHATGIVWGLAPLPVPYVPAPAPYVVPARERALPTLDGPWWAPDFWTVTCSTGTS